jgi:HSP20 family protein
MTTKEKTPETTSRELDIDTRRWFDWSNWPLMSRWFDNMPAPFASEFKVEERIEDGEFVLRCELPGIDPDRDVELYVRDGALVVRAERRQQERREDKGWYRSEFRYGSISRTVPLPRGVTADDVKATYADGILEVRMPHRDETPAPRKIAVTRV